MNIIGQTLTRTDIGKLLSKLLQYAKMHPVLPATRHSKSQLNKMLLFYPNKNQRQIFKKNVDFMIEQSKTFFQ